MDLNVTPLVEVMLMAKSFISLRSRLTLTYDEDNFEIVLQGENFILKRTAFGFVNGSSFTVDARKLLEIANSLESETISIDVDAPWVTLRVNRSSYKIQQLETPLFVDIGTPTHSEFSLSINDTNLLLGMSKNANQNDVREAMQSVIIESRQAYLSFVATNGHVLVVAERENEDEPFNAPLILPKTVATGLKKVASYSDGLSIALGANHVLITSRDVSIYLPRKIAAVPSWRPFLKLPYVHKGILPDILESNVKLAVSIIDKTETKNKLTIPIRLTSKKGILTLEVDANIKHYDELLRATVDNNGETVSSIEIDSPHLSEFQFVMNPNYLIDALSHLRSQSGTSYVEIQLNPKEQLLRLTNDSNLNYFIKVRQQP